MSSADKASAPVQPCGELLMPKQTCQGCLTTIQHHARSARSFDNTEFKVCRRCHRELLNSNITIATLFLNMAANSEATIAGLRIETLGEDGAALEALTDDAMANLQEYHKRKETRNAIVVSWPQPGRVMTWFLVFGDATDRRGRYWCARFSFPQDMKRVCHKQNVHWHVASMIGHLFRNTGLVDMFNLSSISSNDILGTPLT